MAADVERRRRRCVASEAAGRSCRFGRRRRGEPAAGTARRRPRRRADRSSAARCAVSSGQQQMSRPRSAWRARDDRSLASRPSGRASAVPQRRAASAAAADAGAQPKASPPATAPPLPRTASRRGDATQLPTASASAAVRAIATARAAQGTARQARPNRQAKSFEQRNERQRHSWPDTGPRRASRPSGRDATSGRPPRRDASGPSASNITPSPDGGSSGAARDKAPDPNSPFAKLAALKEQLEATARSGLSSSVPFGSPAHRQMAVARAGGAHPHRRRGARERRPCPAQRRARRRRRPPGAARRCRHPGARPHGAGAEGRGLRRAARRCREARALYEDLTPSPSR